MSEFITAQAAAALLGISECRVIQLCQRETLQATHAALPGRSPHRLRWSVDAASVAELRAARALSATQAPVNRRRLKRPVPTPATLRGTVSTQAAAKLLSIRVDTALRYVRTGTLKGKRFKVPAWKGTKRLVRVLLCSVEQFQARRDAPRPPRKPYVRKPSALESRPVLPDPWEGFTTVSVKEAAAMLGRPVSSTFALASAGRLEKRLFPSSAYAKTQTTVRVTTASVETFLAEREAAALMQRQEIERAIQAAQSGKRDQRPAPPKRVKAVIAKPRKVSVVRKFSRPLPVKELPIPPGHLPVSALSALLDRSPSLLLRLFRGGFLRGVITSAGKVLIETASFDEHSAATQDRAFWNSERTRRYHDAGKPTRPVREATAPPPRDSAIS